VKTSAEQAKCKLNEHFESLRQCVNEALSERLETLLQTVDNVTQESLVPLDCCEQDIQNRVDIAKEILDTGAFVMCACMHACVRACVRPLFANRVDHGYGLDLRVTCL